MTQPNQFTSSRARQQKSETNEELRKVVTAKQEVTSHSHQDKMWYSQRDTEAYHRIVEIEGMVMALQAEKEDLEKCREVYRFSSEVFSPTLSEESKP